MGGKGGRRRGERGTREGEQNKTLSMSSNMKRMLVQLCRQQRQVRWGMGSGKEREGGKNRKGGGMGGGGKDVGDGSERRRGEWVRRWG